MTQPKKPSYEQLRNEWYDKLEAEGFDDIESRSGLSIRGRDPGTANSKNPLHWATTQDYYYMATHFLNEYPFESTRDQVIWEYHSNGIGVRSIVKLLHDAGLPGIKKSAVWLVINRLSAIMKAQYLSN